MRRFVAVAVMVGASFVVTAQGFACQCGNIPSNVEEAVTLSSDVFAGEVIDIERAEPWWKYASRWIRSWYYNRVVRSCPESFREEMDEWGRSESYGYIVHFEVQRSWKGAESRKFLVRTGYGSGDCGYVFQEGEVYLVYTRPPDEYLTIPTVDICTKTGNLNDAAPDIERLDKITGRNQQSHNFSLEQTARSVRR